MHDADFREINSEEVIGIAKEKKNSNCPLVVIIGYVDKDSKPVISYSYDVNGAIETYKCQNVTTIPSITGIYGTAAEWFEEEISEFMGTKFKGLENKGRLFLPEEFDGSGQIIVTPLSELRKR